MTQRYEAIVVGGGIVGASATYHLARDGVETLLVDRADEGRATDAGAGILSPGTSRHSDAWFHFAVDAVDYYSELLDSLTSDQDGPIGYAKTGSLAVAVDDDEVDAFDETIERIEGRQTEYGTPVPGSIEQLTPDEARERFPPLGDVQRAFYYEDAARVDGRTFTGALTRAAENRGATILAGDVERLRIDHDSGNVTGVVADGERYDADSVVVAGGAWSASFGEQLGVEIPVEPQRGQIAHLDCDADTEGWPIVSPFRSHYMVSWDDGRVAVGATRETGSGFGPHTTVSGISEVFDEALRVAPGLADASLREVRVGLRPVTPDGLPVLGNVPNVAGVYLATGHGPTGLQLGPYSGRLVARLASGGSSEVDLDPYRVTRF